MAREHMLDEAVNEIAEWLREEPSFYAEALRAGNKTPFAAPANEEQKLQYYARQVFKRNPDGTPNYDQPNDQGRSELLQRVGTEGYKEVMKQLLVKRSPEASAPPIPSHPYVPPEV